MHNMHNREEVIRILLKTCPLVANIFTNQQAPHFAYLDNEQKEGAVVVEMKSPQSVTSFTDFMQDKVIEKATELIRCNLKLQVE